jgi:hypothetical protein
MQLIRSPSQNGGKAVVYRSGSQTLFPSGGLDQLLPRHYPRVQGTIRQRPCLRFVTGSVGVIDTLLVSPALASIPDFDPATQLVCVREMFEDMREKLRKALLKQELREQEVTRPTTRNAYLEGELKLQEQHHSNTLKEVITLRQQLAKRR